MMVWASTAGRDILEPRSAHAISETLEFVVDPRETRMYADLGDAAFKFATDPMTLNSHSWGVDPTKYMTDLGLASMYELTSTSYEPEGEHLAFAASVEGRCSTSSRDSFPCYPFFGTQFHPEKTMT